MPEKSTFEIEIELLIQALLLKYNYDFSNYSRASLERRIRHALVRLGVATVSQLQDRVLRDAIKFRELLGYLTVPTTELFRDPEYFVAIRDQVIPYLETYPSIKIWVAGCSTGEEVYSFAILLHEAGLLNRSLIYATDINQNSLETARRGIYELPVIQNATANYQKFGGLHSFSDYFKASYGAARFDPDLAKRVVFSDHSLATDSVFAEVNLVSCRNVLIYFNRTLQDRAIGLFRDSLTRQGYLGIGTKESLHFSKYINDFTEIAKKERLFQKRGDSTDES